MLFFIKKNTNKTLQKFIKLFSSFIAKKLDYIAKNDKIIIWWFIFLSKLGS